jgi:hypothetical protein
MKPDLEPESISGSPPIMKDPMTWKSFFLWQPMLLVSAYLTTSILFVLITHLFFGMQMREAIYCVPLLLIFVVPCALALASITYLIIRNDLREKKAVTCLFLVVSAGTVLLAHLLLFIFISLFTPVPSG